MPLKPGNSNAAVSNNIDEMMHAYQAKGSIGKTKPRNAAHARLIAIAAAMSNAGRSKAQPGHKPRSRP